MKNKKVPRAKKQSTPRKGRLTQIPDDFWPASLGHISEPLLKPTDDYAVVSEVTSEPAAGFFGNRLLYTALVPLGQVRSTLTTRGGIGHGVECSGPGPRIGPGGRFD